MHKTYEEAMNRKAHRYALLKAAKDEGVIDWGFTERDWTALKAADTGKEMLVTVRVSISKEKYEWLREQYERMEKARAAKRSAAKEKK